MTPKAERLIGNPVRCTHQGAKPGLYPQLYVVGRAHFKATGISREGEHNKSDNHEPEDLPGITKPILGRVSLSEFDMSLENLPVEKRPDFDLTTSSTWYHLIGVGITCLVLWSVIIATISA